MLPVTVASRRILFHHWFTRLWPGTMTRRQAILAEARMDATLLAYLAIAALVFVAAAGAPLPVSGALTAAGALAAAAKLDLVVLVFVASLGAVAGDVLGYTTGQMGGRWFRQGWQTRAPWLTWLHRHTLGASSVRQAIAWCDAMLRRRGGMGAALLLSRTVLAAFGPVINVVSGARHYPLRRFLVFDIAGELIWAATYVGFGYLAASQGDDVTTVLSNPAVIAAGLVLTLAPMVAVAWVRHQTVMRGPEKIGAGD